MIFSVAFPLPITSLSYMTLCIKHGQGSNCVIDTVCWLGPGWHLIVIHRYLCLSLMLWDRGWNSLWVNGRCRRLCQICQFVINCDCDGQCCAAEMCHCLSVRNFIATGEGHCQGAPDMIIHYMTQHTPLIVCTLLHSQFIITNHEQHQCIYMLLWVRILMLYVCRRSIHETEKRLLYLYNYTATYAAQSYTSVLRLLTHLCSWCTQQQCVVQRAPSLAEWMQ